MEVEFSILEKKGNWEAWLILNGESRLKIGSCSSKSKANRLIIDFHILINESARTYLED